MHNFAMESAKKKREIIIENKEYEGASPEELYRIKNLPIKISKYDADIVPNWLAALNMIFSIAIYIFLIIAIVKLIL